MSEKLVVQTQNKTGWIKPVVWLIIIVIIISSLSTAASAVSDFFDFGWFGGSDWRETVSTDNGIKGNVNGGLTEKEVEEFEEEALYKPYYEDIFRNAVVAESANYVTIYREIEETDNFYNLNFVKTDSGLVYDGAVGIKTTGIKVNYWNGHRDFTNVKTTMETDLITYSNFKNNLGNAIVRGLSFNWGGKHKPENIVTFSDFRTTFAPNYNNVNPIVGPINNSKHKPRLFDYISNWLSNNVVHPHFQNLTDNLTDVSVEMINGIENVENAEAVKQRLNTFGTYLWENSRSSDRKEKQTVVDVSKYYGSFIPKELQVDYPLQGEDVERFEGFENYPIYDNKVFFNVSYITNDVEPNRNQNTVQKNGDVVKDAGKIDKKRPMQQEVFSILNVKLNNKTNSSLATADLKENPVIITIGDRTLVFDSPAKINSGASIALESNKTYYYEINSKELVFDSLSGSIAMSDVSATKTFDFSYIENYMLVHIGLMPATSSVPGSIDLKKYPVKIIFTGRNGEGTYKATFDKDYYAYDYSISVLMPAGEYDYTVLSGQLLFADSGTIFVNSDNRSFSFLYTVNTDTSDVEVYANVHSSLRRHEPHHEIILAYEYADDVVPQLFDYLGSFKISIVLFDNNTILWNKELVSSGSYVHKIRNIDQSIFINKNKFKLQLMFTSIEDSTKSILANAVDLYFENDTLGYETTISLTVVVN